MNKLFTKIAAASLSLAMAVGVGVAVGANAKKATPVHAAITSEEAAGLTVLTSSNFDTSAEYVLKSTDGYYWNGVSGTSSSKWGGITKTLSEVERLTISGTWSDGFTIEDSSGNYLRATTGNMTWATTQAGTYKMGTDSASNPIVYNGTANGVKVNGTSGIRVYTNLTYNASTGKSVALYKIPSTKSLSSIALSGTYPTSFTIGDTFSHEGMTVTATYSDSTTANVTSSATFSGYNMSTAGNQTVTVSYTESGTTKTATYSITVSAPTNPYINPAKNSTSGYTGQNESLSFTYGNLTSTLGVSSSNTSVVTVETPSTSAGSGTVQINFVAEGSTTVKFKDGSTELASVSVSVSASSVTITGLAATSTAYIGKTLNLGSTITVTATGIYTNAVTWESEDDNIATVSAAGVVTGVAEGTVDITVTSDDYPSATMTCSVTVEEAPLETTYDFTKNFSTYASSWSTSYSSKTLNGKTQVGGDYDATIYFELATKQTSNITTMPVVADQASGDVVHVTFVLKETGYELGNVSVTFAQWTTKTPTMKLFKGKDATGTLLDSGVVGTKNTISATNVGGTAFSVTMNDNSTSRNQVGVQSINITLKAAPVLSSVTTSGQKTTFEYGDTFSYGGTLTAHYTQGKADATVSPSKFKFGASGINPDSAGTDITVGTALSHATHDGTYIYVGYTEVGSTYKWSSYQITVEDAPTYYMVLDAYTDTGTNYGYKGGVIEIDVTESNLAGNITWTVTAGSVTDTYSDNDCYMATIASVGTLTIVATDSGYTSSTHTISITVVNSLNTVMAPSETPHASDLTFTAQAGGSGTADDGATYTVTSDAAESTYEEARGIHFGTNSSATVQYVQLSSSNVASGENDVIKSVVVNASDAQTEGNTASLTVTVGGESFHCSGSTTATLGGQATYTFTGSGSGTVVVRAERTEAKYKGIYFKSVVVNYVTTGAESNIANATGMHLAQMAVIDYADDFINALDDVCVAYGSTDVEDLESAWSALVTQYDIWFNNGGLSLSSEEIAHAKALFAHASSDENGDSLQKMLAQYDWIVSHYEGCSDFLNTDAGTGRDPVNTAIRGNSILAVDGNNATAIIVIVALVSITAIGGYFAIRKRKEQ